MRATTKRGRRSLANFRASGNGPSTRSTRVESQYSRISLIFPLSIPGVLAGATFAFVLSLGDFLAPLLLGGPSGVMISNIVVSLFGAAYNWPLGAAISLCMLALVLGLLYFSERLEKKWSFS